MRSFNDINRDRFSGSEDGLGRNKLLREQATKDRKLTNRKLRTLDNVDGFSSFERFTKRGKR